MFDREALGQRRCTRITRSPSCAGQAAGWRRSSGGRPSNCSGWWSRMRSRCPTKLDGIPISKKSCSGATIIVACPRPAAGCRCPPIAPRRYRGVATLTAWPSHMPRRPSAFVRSAQVQATETPLLARATRRLPGAPPGSPPALKFAAAYGFRNIQTVVRKLKTGRLKGEDVSARLNTVRHSTLISLLVQGTTMSRSWRAPVVATTVAAS